MKTIRHISKFDATNTVRSVLGSTVQTAVDQLNIFNRERFDCRHVNWHAPYDNNGVFYNHGSRYNFRLYFEINNTVLTTFGYVILDTWWLKDSCHKAVVDRAERNMTIFTSNKHFCDTLQFHATLAIETLLNYDKEQVPRRDYARDHDRNGVN